MIAFFSLVTIALVLAWIIFSLVNLPQSYQSRVAPEINAPHDGCVQRENAGFLAPLQTKITISGKVSITSGATVPLPQPPQGKVWCMTDLDLSHDSTVAIEFTIKSNTIAVFDWPVKGDTAPFIGHNLETQIDIPEGNSASLVMGSNNATNGYFYLTGVQQNIGNG